MRLVVDSKSKCFISLEDKYCLLVGRSGVGKTYVYNLIQNYCTFINRRCILLNYRLSREDIVALISSIDSDDTITLVDNTEIIMDSEVERMLCLKPGMKVVSTHKFDNLRLFPCFHPTLYYIDFNVDGYKLYVSRGETL